MSRQKESHISDLWSIYASLRRSIITAVPELPGDPEEFYAVMEAFIAENMELGV